jgi:hypothetical protein
MEEIGNGASTAAFSEYTGGNVMRMLIGFLVLVTIVASFGCGRGKSPGQDAVREQVRNPSQLDSIRSRQTQAARAGNGAFQGASEAEVAAIGQQDVSLADASAAEASTKATDRKIIKNADITIEVDAPKEAQARIGSIAEARGGFVVTSEFKQSASGASRVTEIVTIVVRVPSSTFDSAVEAIRGTGNRVIQEKISGQDVTEEYIDLEARIRTQKALEGQFLEIMKQARKIEDALQVQRQLAEVRTEIERLEGRRRFLDNKSSLSTITVTLQTATPMVTATTSGFGHDVKDAFGDGVDTAVGIVLGVIRVAIILVPITILIVIPVWLLLRRLLRRFSWPRRQEPLAVTPAE